MAITQPDLKHFLSEVVATGATNGGMMSENQAVDAQKNNVWPNVSAAMRETGGTMYRKIFGSPRNVGSEALSAIKVWLHGPTAGDDYVYMFAGTKTDTEADFSQTVKYAAADLAADITTGDTACTITCEDAVTTLGFHASGKVAISDQLYPGARGASLVVTLSSTPPLVSGLTVTLYFETAITAGFLASNTVVGAVMEPSDIEATTGTIVVTSASGTVDESVYPPVCYNKGTRDETLTASFSTTTNFTVSGSRSGALGSGTVDTDFVATHPTNSATLITIPAGFFSATGFVALDTVVIPTIGCNFAYWEARVIPALADSLNGNQAISAYTGESG